MIACSGAWRGLERVFCVLGVFKLETVRVDTKVSRAPKHPPSALRTFCDCYTFMLGAFALLNRTSTVFVPEVALYPGRSVNGL